MRLTPNDERFLGSTDSESIQNAIDFAAASGENRVYIPRRNLRTGLPIWIIDKTVLLPSDMTVVLEDAHLRLADGVRENIFRNRNCWTPEGVTQAGEQHDIRILGQGHAVLDGGEPNGLCEQLHRDDPAHYPHMHVNLLVLLHNTRDFEVSGIHVIDSRWWSFCFIYCRWGRIRDLDFRMYGNLENQDGINLRVGCSHILIENITGITGDDTVALTALPMDYGDFEMALAVEGRDPDIHDVCIRNILSSSHGCTLVRFLCEDGARIYNVDADNIRDTGASIGGSAILVGVTQKTLAISTFCKKRSRQLGELFNITIRNVSTCAQRAILLAEPIRDLLIENVYTFGGNEIGIRICDNCVLDNVTLRNLVFRSDPETFDSAFFISPLPQEASADLHIEHVRSSSPKFAFRGMEPPVQDCRIDPPQQAWFTPEPAKLASAYGRYHLKAWGKPIEDRPKDSRFSNGEAK